MYIYMGGSPGHLQGHVGGETFYPLPRYCPITPNPEKSVMKSTRTI